MWPYSEQIWVIFFTQGLQFIVHLLFGPDHTVQPSPVLWYKVSPHKCQGFSDVEKCLEHIRCKSCGNFNCLLSVVMSHPEYYRAIRLLLKQGLDWDWTAWDWTGDGLEMDWSISHS